jgi:MarR family transcriptional regulator, lower aerobic nicotinate degradation pathway regulator
LGGVYSGAVTRGLPTQLGLLLRQAHQRARKGFNDALEPLGLEGRHFGVLMTLSRLGPATQARLIVELNSDKSAMLRTVDDLEQRGLVQRRPVPDDRRSHTVELTAKGRQQTAAAGDVAERVGEQVFAGLTAAEQRTLRDLLARFVAGGAPTEIS